MQGPLKIFRHQQRFLALPRPFRAFNTTLVLSFRQKTVNKLYFYKITQWRADSSTVQLQDANDQAPAQTEPAATCAAPISVGFTCLGIITSVPELG